MKAPFELLVHAPVGGTSWAKYAGWLHEALRIGFPDQVAEKVIPPGASASRGGSDRRVHLVCGPMPMAADMLQTLPLGQPAIVYTGWESTAMPVMPAAMLSRAKAVVVPSQFAQVVFAAAGALPTRIVRHGVHRTYVCRPLNRKVRTDDVIRVGAGGAWRGAGERKRLLSLVGLFAQWAKRGDLPHAKLSVRVPDLPDWSQRALKDVPTLEWKVGRELSVEAQADWYDSIDGYITLSMGEGYDLMSAEAMARGLPVAGPAWGATGEHRLVVPMDYRLTPMSKACGYYPAEALGAWVDDRELAKAWGRLLQITSQLRGTRVLPVEGVRTVDDAAMDLIQVIEEVLPCRG